MGEGYEKLGSACLACITTMNLFHTYIIPLNTLQPNQYHGDLIIKTNTSTTTTISKCTYVPSSDTIDFILRCSSTNTRITLFMFAILSDSMVDGLLYHSSFSFL